MPSILPRTVARDDHDRVGIVVEKRSRPSAKWLADQIHAPSAEDMTAQWWAVMPFQGGLVLCPETRLIALRPATYEDFLQAVEGANDHGRSSLATLFPEYVRRASDAVLHHSLEPDDGA